jgi:hypothetical protein
MRTLVQSRYFNVSNFEQLLGPPIGSRSAHARRSKRGWRTMFKIAHTSSAVIAGPLEGSPSPLKPKKGVTKMISRIVPIDMALPS